MNSPTHDDDDDDDGDDDDDDDHDDDDDDDDDDASPVVIAGPGKAQAFAVYISAFFETVLHVFEWGKR